VKVDLTPDDNAIADGKVYETKYTYHGDGNRVRTVSQSDGTALTIGYEAHGDDYRVHTITNGEGHITRYQYISENHTRVSIGGNYVDYFFDDKQRLVGKEQVVNNQIIRNEYVYHSSGNALGKLKHVTDGLGRTTEYTYDERGNLTKEQSSDSQITRQYNEYNQLVLEIRNDDESRYVYDAQQRLIFSLEKQKNDTFQVTEYRYNATGLRASQHVYTNANYTDNHYSYDSLSQWLTSIDLSAQQQTRYSYDFRGQLKSLVRYLSADSLGNPTNIVSNTHYVYDPYGLLQQEVDTKAGQTSYSYDGLGRMLAKISSEGVTTQYIYDEQSRRLAIVDDNTQWQTHSFDKTGALVSIAYGTSFGDSSQGIERFYLDKQNRKVVSESTQGARSYVFYDEAGRKAAKVDEQGFVTRVIFNQAHDQIHSTKYERALDTSNWLADGQLTLSLAELDEQLNRLTAPTFSQVGAAPKPPMMRAMSFASAPVAQSLPLGVYQYNLDSGMVSLDKNYHELYLSEFNRDQVFFHKSSDSTDLIIQLKGVYNFVGGNEHIIVKNWYSLDASIKSQLTQVNLKDATLDRAQISQDADTNWDLQKDRFFQQAPTSLWGNPLFDIDQINRILIGSPDNDSFDTGALFADQTYMGSGNDRYDARGLLPSHARTLYMGKGDDTFELIMSRTTFHYQKGDGNDTIKAARMSDNILVLHDISRDDVLVRHEGTDVIITLNSSGEQITLEGWLFNNNHIQFEGDVIPKHFEGMLGNTIRTHNSDTQIIGTKDSDRIILSTEFNGEIVAGKGNDFIYRPMVPNTSSELNFVHNPGDGTDHFYGVRGNIQINGVNRADAEVVIEGTMLKIVLPTLGDAILIKGQYDSITFNGSQPESFTVAELAAQVTQIQGGVGVDYLHGNKADNVVHDLEGAQQINLYSGNNVIYSQSKGDIFIPSTGSDVIYTQGSEQILDIRWMKFNDIMVTRFDGGYEVTGGQGVNVTIHGWQGENKGYIKSGDELVDIDSLVSNSTMHYALADGMVELDIDVNKLDLSAFSNDQVLFHQSSDSSDLIIQLKGVYNFVGGNEHIIVKDWYSLDASIKSQLTQVNLKDATLDRAQISQDADTNWNLKVDRFYQGDVPAPWSFAASSEYQIINNIFIGSGSGATNDAAGANADTLYLGDGDNKLDANAFMHSRTPSVVFAGKGDDDIRLWGKGHTYHYRAGDGNDKYYADASERNALVLHGVSREDVDIITPSLMEYSGNVIVKFKNTAEQITLKGWHRNNSYIKFADEVYLPFEQGRFGIFKQAFEGQHTFVGSNDNERIKVDGSFDGTVETGKGNDYVFMGHDRRGVKPFRLIYNQGDGVDYVTASPVDVEINGLKRQDIQVQMQGVALKLVMPTEGDVLYLEGSSGSVTFKENGQARQFTIQELRNEAKVVLDAPRVNRIDSTQADNIIYDGEGADAISLSGGNDTVYSSSDGDWFFVRAGNHTIHTEGNDQIISLTHPIEELEYRQTSDGFVISSASGELTVHGWQGDNAGRIDLPGGGNVYSLAEFISAIEVGKLVLVESNQSVTVQGDVKRLFVEGDNIQVTGGQNLKTIHTFGSNTTLLLEESHFRSTAERIKIENHDNGQVLKFKDLARSEVVFTQRDGFLELKLKSNANHIVLKNWIDGNNYIQFSDSESPVKVNDIGREVISYQSGSVLHGSSKADTFFLQAGNHTVHLSATESDRAFLQSSNNTVVRQYVGSDQRTWSSQIINFGQNQLLKLKGFDKEKLVFARTNESDVVVRLFDNDIFHGNKPYRGELGLDKWLNASNKVQFDDGEILELDTLVGVLHSLGESDSNFKGSDLGDMIYASGDYREVIEAGKGNDLITGARGQTIIYKKGDGSDLIDFVGDSTNFEKSNKLMLKEVKRSDVDIYKYADDTFQIAFKDSNDVLTLHKQFDNKDFVVFEGDSDAQLNPFTLDNVIVVGSDKGDERLEGGTGDDVYRGGAGHDTYAFSGGHDTIEDNGGTLLFETNVSFGHEALVFKRNYQDLIVNVQDGQHSITIKNWFDSSHNKVDLKFARDPNLALSAAEIEQAISYDPLPSYLGNTAIAIQRGEAVRIPLQFNVDMAVPLSIVAQQLPAWLSYDSDAQALVGNAPNEQTHEQVVLSVKDHQEQTANITISVSTSAYIYTGGTRSVNNTQGRILFTDG
ncbi:calcium-binding protein, partial [Pseudoalteromonas holothuriae]|uniref:calcium-binding protein n=1 Tax=Pseudoalteromonas holothuriae TaxID=2963714 RepID=UPI0039659CA3